MAKLNIAITADLRDDPTQSIWSNGGNQHCFFLYLLLKALPSVANVWLASNIRGDQLSPNMFLDDVRQDVVPLGDVLNNVDILIEMNSSINQEHAAIVRARNGKVITYKFGNEYVMAVEGCSFGAHKGWVPHKNGVTFDEIWTNPQHDRTCTSFFKHLYKAPVHVLPHLWSPYFVEQALRRNPQTAQNWPYRKRNEKRVIGIFEPNLNVVKSSIIPMFAAGKFAEDHPDLLEHIYMLNTAKLAKNPLFSRLVRSTNAGRTGVTSAEGRFSFVDFAAKYIDIVVSHQWENGLNYHYYEALYGGYPLVHNSSFLKDAGYYYPEFDIDAGCQAILKAAQTHDDDLEAYEVSAAAALEQVDPLAAGVQGSYQDRLEKLLA